MQLTIKEWRRLKGITQEEMANACGVHVNTYRSWEEKPKSIKLINAMKISERLGVSLDDIIIADLSKRTGIARRTLYNKKQNPGDIKLREFGPLAADLNDAEIIEIVRAWE